MYFRGTSYILLFKTLANIASKMLLYYCILFIFYQSHSVCPPNIVNCDFQAPPLRFQLVILSLLTPTLVAKQKCHIFCDSSQRLVTESFGSAFIKMRGAAPPPSPSLFLHRPISPTDESGALWPRQHHDGRDGRPAGVFGGVMVLVPDAVPVLFFPFYLSI